MDLFNKLASAAESAAKQDNQQQPPQQPQQSSADDLLGKLGSFTGGGGGSSNSQDQKQEGGSSLVDKLHGLAGGGPESEKREDALDKGIDWVQETLLKQGPQDNESAGEQAKDRLIAESIRDQYKKATGKEFPLKEKEEVQQQSAGGGLGGFGDLGKKFGL
ncbi:hypothetical protein QBC47DRAFT_381559 [Echria macrotheca]|uniref:Uncharacterized protein n=1 Tax=Echria macrotheca TaxID=438768 RepID=A0AAJ0F5L6_9PEZI|nr:hypothetical protein QBC47DRAFT_381559 [Echria macrotheca]